MMKSMKSAVVLEAKDVGTYKKLIQALGDFSKSQAFTGVDKLFKKAIDDGKKILPKDKQALAILDHLLQGDSTSSSKVQQVLNTRFDTLPIEVRPIIKSGDNKEVAFWMVADRMSDKVQDLINFSGEGKGKWVDKNGEKATLVVKDNS